jgi:YVTN family beta-propeller protein
MKKIPCIAIGFLSVFILLTPGYSAKTSRIKKVGKAPNFIALSPAGGKLYATSYATGELLGIDLTKNSVTQKVYVGSSPLGLAIADEGKTALVACRDSGTVSVVDLAAFRVIKDISFGAGSAAKPNFVAMSPRGYRAYVSDGYSREGLLHIIDMRDRKVVGTLKMGVSPFAIAVSPTTEMVYVVMRGNNEVWVVDPEKQVVVKKIVLDGGAEPSGIAITPDGKYVFVANNRTDNLSMIDAQLMSVKVTVPVGKSPFCVTISPDGKRVFVVNIDSRNVQVLPTDLSDLTGTTFDAGKGPVDIKVDADNRTVYVVNETSNSILIAEVP